MNNSTLTASPPNNLISPSTNPLDVPGMILYALCKLEESNRAIIEAVTDLAHKLEKSQTAAAKKKRFYTVKEAMIELNRSDKAIYDLVDRGLLKTDKSSGKLYIPASEIEAFEGRIITKGRRD